MIWIEFEFFLRQLMSQYSLARGVHGLAHWILDEVLY